MRLLIAGATGQLAQALAETCAHHGVDTASVGRPGLDLTDPERIDAQLGRTCPSIVVNAAAYTAVDEAEANAGLAHSVNAAGAGALAEACERRGIAMVHISTDFVFDGRTDRAYRPDDRPAPVNVYGRTKWEGERLVAANSRNHVILRTAWLHSPFGGNFVRTILRLAETMQEISVVGDQVGNPTYALHLANAVLRIALTVAPDTRARWCGIYHAAGSGTASRCMLAEEVLACSRRLGGPWARVRPAASADYPTAAQRPANSALDCSGLQQTFGIALPSWQAGVRACVARLVKGEGVRTGLTAHGTKR